MTHNMALCAIPLLHCHTDSFAVPGDRATARGAAIGAPACRHPSRQRRRSAVLKKWSGRLSPGPRPSPRCSSPLPSPRGDCAPRSASVLANSSDARAKDALLCSTLTRPPAASVAVSRQPPHASLLSASGGRLLSSCAGPAFTMPPCVAATDRVTTPSLLE